MLCILLFSIYLLLNLQIYRDVISKKRSVSDRLALASQQEVQNIAELSKPADKEENFPVRADDGVVPSLVSQQYNIHSYHAIIS